MPKSTGSPKSSETPKQPILSKTLSSFFRSSSQSSAKPKDQEQIREIARLTRELTKQLPYLSRLANTKASNSPPKLSDSRSSNSSEIQQKKVNASQVKEGYQELTREITVFFEKAKKQTLSEKEIEDAKKLEETVKKITREEREKEKEKEKERERGKQVVKSLRGNVSKKRTQEVLSETLAANLGTKKPLFAKKTSALSDDETRTVEKIAEKLSELEVKRVVFDLNQFREFFVISSSSNSGDKTELDKSRSADYQAFKLLQSKLEQNGIKFSILDDDTYNTDHKAIKRFFTNLEPKIEFVSKSAFLSKEKTVKDLREDGKLFYVGKDITNEEELSKGLSKLSRSDELEGLDEQDIIYLTKESQQDKFFTSQNGQIINFSIHDEETQFPRLSAPKKTPTKKGLTLDRYRLILEKLGEELELSNSIANETASGFGRTSNPRNSSQLDQFKEDSSQDHKEESEEDYESKSDIDISDDSDEDSTTEVDDDGASVASDESSETDDIDSLLTKLGLSKPEHLPAYYAPLDNLNNAPSAIFDSLTALGVNRVIIALPAIIKPKATQRVKAAEVWTAEAPSAAEEKIAIPAPKAIEAEEAGEKREFYDFNLLKELVEKLKDRKIEISIFNGISDEEDRATKEFLETSGIKDVKVISCPETQKEEDFIAAQKLGGKLLYLGIRKEELKQTLPRSLSLSSSSLSMVDLEEEQENANEATFSVEEDSLINFLIPPESKVHVSSSSKSQGLTAERLREFLEKLSQHQHERHEALKQSFAAPNGSAGSEDGDGTPSAESSNSSSVSSASSNDGAAAAEREITSALENQKLEEEQRLEQERVEEQERLELERVAAKERQEREAATLKQQKLEEEIQEKARKEAEEKAERERAAALENQKREEERQRLEQEKKASELLKQESMKFRYKKDGENSDSLKTIKEILTATKTELQEKPVKSSSDETILAIKPEELAAYNLEFESKGKKIECGNKFSFSTSNDEIKGNVDQEYRKKVIEILKQTMNQYNSSEEKVVEIDETDMAKFILLAVNNDGIGNPKDVDKFEKEFDRVFANDPNKEPKEQEKQKEQKKIAAQDVSELFQQNATAAKIFTGNKQDSKNKRFVGLRMKRLDPLFALEILRSKDAAPDEQSLKKSADEFKKISGQVLNKEINDVMAEAIPDLFKDVPGKSPSPSSIRRFGAGRIDGSEIS